MAANVNIGGSGALFVGEDKKVRLELRTKAGVPVDMSGWVILFDLRKKDTSPPPALIAKNATITGAYNATPASNTQRAEVVFTDDELGVLKGQPYRYSMKRMDDGSEAVLAYGNFSPQKATAP